MKTRTVLIAVDAPLVALELELALEDASAKTRNAGSVPQALSVIESESLDFALVDTRLGDTSTTEVMAALALEQIKFIVFTDNVHGRGGIFESAATVISKPFVIEDLLAHILRLW